MANPSPFHYNHVYYRCLLAADRLSPSRAKITYAGRDDGIGAQVHSILSLHAYARLRKLELHCRPIKDIEHNYANSPTWESDWNSFFNLPTSDYGPETESIFLRQVTRQLWLKQGRCYAMTKAHRFVDFFPAIYTQIMPQLREAYNDSDFPKKSLFSDDVTTLKIAMHLRRGDVLQLRPERASSIEKAANELSWLKQKLEGMGIRYEVIVFSQGDQKEFAMLESPQTRIHLEDDPFSAVHTMIRADVFLMAQSALSYVAGLYSSGTVVYRPHWHPCIPGWVSRLKKLPKHLKEIKK
jgi:hypothetical protein